jgi:hypothetical protein
MSKNLVYYSPNIEPVSKRKHLLFLEKSGFEIDRFYNIEDLKGFLETSKPAGFILTEDSNIDEILGFDLPILMILKSDKNTTELMEKYFNLDIFFRFDNDPISTILETANLIQKVSSYNE